MWSGGLCSHGGFFGSTVSSDFTGIVCVCALGGTRDGWLQGDARWCPPFPAMHRSGAHVRSRKFLGTRRVALSCKHMRSYFLCYFLCLPDKRGAESWCDDKTRPRSRRGPPTRRRARPRVVMDKRNSIPRALNWRNRLELFAPPLAAFPPSLQACHSLVTTRYSFAGGFFN